jgi:photosystem II stability/assembly factor-like uncharacterized protein
LIKAASDSSSTPHVYWTFEVRFPWQERIVKTQQEAETLGAANRCVTSAPSFQGSRSFTVLVECSARIGNPVSAHLYQTQDDGWTWSRSTLPQPYFPNLGGYQRTFDWLWLRDEIGWAIVTDEYATETESGNLLTRLYQTETGGASWSFVKSVYWRGEFDFVDEVHGWALAYARGENALVRTTNGGRTWELLSPRLVR